VALNLTEQYENRRVALWDMQARRIITGIEAPFAKDLYKHLTEEENARQMVYIPAKGGSLPAPPGLIYPEPSGPLDNQLARLNYKIGQRRVAVLNRKTGKKISGFTAPMAKGLRKHLQNNPHVIVYIPYKHAQAHLSSRSMSPATHPAPAPAPEAAVDVKNDTPRVAAPVPLAPLPPAPTSSSTAALSTMSIGSMMSGAPYALPTMPLVPPPFFAPPIPLFLNPMAALQTHLQTLLLRQHLQQLLAARLTQLFQPQLPPPRAPATQPVANASSAPVNSSSSMSSTTSSSV
jgi:hypothetical protein